MTLRQRVPLPQWIVLVLAAMLLPLATEGAVKLSVGAGPAPNWPGTHTPVALAVDADGNILVADAGNGVVQVLSRETWSPLPPLTLAGRPWLPENPDGAANRGRITVQGIACDAMRNVYVSSGNAIRRIDSDGNIETVAGSFDEAGSADGNGREARFASPRGLACDASGSLFIADTGNATIRKLATDGSVTTVAGAAGQPGGLDGMPGVARLREPRAIALTTEGGMFVTDGSAVRRLFASGRVLTIAGRVDEPGSVDGIGAAARFRAPDGISLTARGDFLIADPADVSLRRVTIGGVVTTVSTTAAMCTPVAAIERGHAITVADPGRHAVAQYVPSQPGECDAPAALTAVAAIEDGHAWISPDQHRVYIRSRYMNAALGGTEPGAVDGFPSAARFKLSESLGSGGLARGGGLTFDGAHQIFVADTFNHTIRRYASPMNMVATVAGAPGIPGSADGAGAAARFSHPLDIAIARLGMVVLDAGNFSLRLMQGAGDAWTVSTVAGGSRGHSDGSGPAARFDFTDGNGIVAGGIAVLNPYAFVADTGNHVIRRVDLSTGAVTTIAGTPGQAGSADGSGSAARFTHPTRIALLPGGGLLVTEESERRVRLVHYDGTVSTVAGGHFDWSVSGAGEHAGFVSPRGVAAFGSDVYIADGSSLRRARRVPDIDVQVSPEAGTTGQPIALSVSGTSYPLWSLIGGPAEMAGWVSNAAATTLTPRAPGAYLIRLATGVSHWLGLPAFLAEDLEILVSGPRIRTTVETTVHVAPNPTPIGEWTTVTVTFTNTGPFEAEGIISTLTPDEGFTADLPEGCQNIGGPPCPGCPSTIECRVPRLAAGHTLSLPVRFRFMTPGNRAIWSWTTVATPGSTDHEIEVPFIVGPQADLGLSFAGELRAAPGERLTHRFTVTNESPGTASSGSLRVFGGAILSIDGKDPSCSFIGTAGQSLECHFDALSPAASRSFTVVFRAIETGVGSVYAFIQAVEGDPDTADDWLSREVVVSPVGGTADLEVVLSGGEGLWAPGDRIGYVASVANGGPSPATGAVLEIAVPLLLIVDNVPDGCVIEPLACPACDTRIRCDLGVLGLTEHPQFVVETRAAAPGSATISASVQATETDPVATNNRAIVATEILDIDSIAAFGFAPAAPVVGAAVLFTDASPGAVSWAWDFGDGGVSTAQSPLHTYAAAGDYVATLSARDAGGTVSTATRIVHVTEPAWEPSLVVPGIAHTNGAEGSYFRSSLWVVNAAAVGTRVRLTYRPVGGDGGHNFAAGKSHPVWQPSIERTLAPGESLAWSDFVLEAFAAGWDSSGTVVAEVPQGLPVPVVAARTYNDAGPAGTYGQYIPSAVLGAFPAVTSDLRIYGLGADARARTNLGVVNRGGGTVEAEATLFDAAGVARGGSLHPRVPPFEATQINRVNEAAGAGTLSLFGAHVTSGTSGLQAYGSKLDATTSDPIYIPGDLTARVDQWIDGVAAAPGDLGTLFRTELVLASPVEAATLTVDYTPRGATAATGSATVLLAAGQTRLYRDALGELFGVTESAGSLRLRSTAAVVAWARTYSDRGAGGTYGQFIPAFGVNELLRTTGAVLTGVTENAQFRTNLGALNTSGAPVTLRVEVWSRAGSRRGERTYTIPPGGSLFEFRLLEQMELAPLADAYVRVVPSASGALYAWTSTVDAVSSDPTFVPPHGLPLR